MLQYGSSGPKNIRFDLPKPGIRPLLIDKLSNNSTQTQDPTAPYGHRVAGLEPFINRGPYMAKIPV